MSFSPDSIDQLFFNGFTEEPLPVDRQNELALLAKAGDMEARDCLLRSYNRFFMKIAGAFYRSYQNDLGVNMGGLEYNDFYMMAFEGGMVAVEKYDRTRGDFLQCMSLYVRSFLLSELSSMKRKNYGLSVDDYRDIRRLRKSKVGDVLCVEDVMEILDCSAARARRIFRVYDSLARKEVVSLDDVVAGNGENRRLIDLVSDEFAVQADVLLFRKQFNIKIREKLRELYDDLSDIERLIFDHRIMVEGDRSFMTLGEIGARFGLTRVRVGQIQKDLRRRVKHKLYRYFDAEDWPV